MNIKVKKNNAPNLKLPKFSVDGELHSKLNDYDITKLMNKSNFTLFLGRAGSGKSSLLISFMKTPELFKKVYSKIFLFMPAGSRSSINDSFFEKYLSSDQIFDELNYENLQKVYDIAQEIAEDNGQTLIIFDDVQKAFRDTQIAKLFLSMVNNRRHGRLSLWLAMQNYKSLVPQIRMGLTDIFVFKINKTEMQTIFEEHIEQHKENFIELLKYVFKNPHDFMYLNTGSQRIFSNWDEIIIPED